MAIFKIPTFAVGTYASILPNISSGVLTYPSYVFCSDTNTMVFVDKNMEIQDLKGYNQDSVIIVDTLPTDDIRDDAFYICNGVGYLYINGIAVPVFQDMTVTQEEVQKLIDAKGNELKKYVDQCVFEAGGISSYDQLTDLPIVNLYGDVTSPVVLADLEDGNYAVSGHYQIGGTLTTIHIVTSKILFQIVSDKTSKHITQLSGAERIYIYSVTTETGATRTSSYATEGWVYTQGYSTENYVNEAIEELYQKLITELTITKVSQLENDAGYLTQEDIGGIGSSDIASLFNI